MLAPPASPPAPPRRRLLVAAASTAALCMAALLLAALPLQSSRSSQLSAERFFRSVDPALVRLMSPTVAADEAAAELRLSSPPPPAHATLSSSFYRRVSGRLARLMGARAVLDEDASELDDSKFHVSARASVPPQLPYDEAQALGVPMSIAAFQRADAAVGGPLKRSAAPVPVCHACVRAAAAAAKARAVAASRVQAAQAAEERLLAARHKQREDAAAAAAKIAKQRALIAKLQSDPSFPHAALKPMQDAVVQEQARAAAAALADAAATQRAARDVRA